MKHYLFEDLKSGEEFIVGAATIGEAMTIAIDEFGESVKYRYQMTEEEADASGLDEYQARVNPRFSFQNCDRAASVVSAANFHYTTTHAICQEENQKKNK